MIQRHIQLLKQARHMGLILCALVLTSTHVNARGDKDLKGVSDKISQQKNQLNQQQKKLNELQRDLKNHETSISNMGQTISKTQQLINSAQSNLSQLQQQKKQLEETKLKQQKVLEELVQTYYITKRNNNVSVILSGGDPIEQDRLTQYYQYLANARVKAIEDLDKTTRELDKKVQEVASQQNKQSQLLAEQRRKQSELQKTQSQRQSTVSKIRNNIKSTQASLAELQRNEQSLKDEIAKAAKRNTSNMSGLAQNKGKLPWPLQGTVAHNYGTQQSGQVTWKGIVINTKNNQPVKAVQAGKVVFAEWLRGYGLVILLDHGKGDMTLYGYNATLLKKDGDVVAQGETIALAGDTGGQDRPALYFEVRRNSQPQNPRNWLSK